MLLLTNKHNFILLNLLLQPLTSSKYKVVLELYPDLTQDQRMPNRFSSCMRTTDDKGAEQTSVLTCDQRQPF